MKTGIKVGLRDYKTKIPTTGASVCEVYFRFDKNDQYDELFKSLKNRNIKAGLHYWGVVKKNILYNLAYPDSEIQKETLSQIKETIDIASRYKLRYVNVHPGNYRLVKLNLDSEVFEDGGNEISQVVGKRTLFENVKLLHQCALERNILFLIETVPSRYGPVWYDENSRLTPLRLGDPNVQTIIELANLGFYVTNDLGHTLADETSNNRSYLFEKLFEKTLVLAKQTRLIHVNTTRPPFNGTDTHDGVTPEDFKNNVLPSKPQLNQLLEIFKKRDDVWLIPEPLKNHEENFINLQKMIEKIEK